MNTDSPSSPLKKREKEQLRKLFGLLNLILILFCDANKEHLITQV